MRSTMRIYHIIFTGLICLTGLVLFDGCTSLRNEIDPSLLGVEPSKLVVNCFLSPQDDILAVKVTRSATVVGDSISLLQTGNNVTNATVTLSEGGQSVVLSYNNVASNDSTIQPYYSTAAVLLPIIQGHTYTLTVTANGQRATGTCTIPAPVPPTVITLDSLNRRYYVVTKWQDPPGQTNYYQVAGIFRYITNTCRACLQESNINLSFDDENRGLFTDAGMNGTLITSGRAFLTAAATANFYNQYRTASVIVNLMSVDQAYYQYEEAIIRQRRSRNNPFAEPVLIPSNIQGGIGCFGGYNNETLTLKIK